MRLGAVYLCKQECDGLNLEGSRATPVQHSERTRRLFDLRRRVPAVRLNRHPIYFDDGAGKTWFRINRVNFRTRTQHRQELLALLSTECESVLGALLARNPPK